MLRKVDSLSEVVAGDLVAILTDGWDETMIEFRVVKAVTKLWIQDERTNWRRKDGTEVGAGYSHRAPKIVPATDDLLAAYRHQRRSAWVTAVMEELVRSRVRKLSPAVVVGLVEALSAACPGKPAPSFADEAG